MDFSKEDYYSYTIPEYFDPWVFHAITIQPTGYSGNTEETETTSESFLIQHYTTPSINV